MTLSRKSILKATLGLFVTLSVPMLGQMIDKTKAPNTINEGISKSLTDEIGAGRGDLTTPNSSAFIISRDPFRAIRRGSPAFSAQVHTARRPRA
ncbi:MAG TPA: hypothetical protein VMW38_27175 [Terriglobia bacterium]|nr:hypothetical protein [Terriglobia bacterium]